MGDAGAAMRDMAERLGPHLLDLRWYQCMLVLVWYSGGVKSCLCLHSAVTCGKLNHTERNKYRPN